ncbi:hypothetical protein SLEP1_g38100 [Rubroshorea leprosula]|uniref:Uncharacterized protein n=1 Tax=Rubroshorea leprosula TaxID=152421 RepID=A0AAV5KWX1_9ROSI|nr:hypothetical protein SLEP1_g38100 [Rubroshorea leprosula]
MPTLQICAVEKVEKHPAKCATITFIPGAFLFEMIMVQFDSVSTFQGNKGLGLTWRFCNNDFHVSNHILKYG